MKPGEEQNAAATFDFGEFFENRAPRRRGFGFIRVNAIGDNSDGIFQAQTPEIFRFRPTERMKAAGLLEVFIFKQKPNRFFFPTRTIKSPRFKHSVRRNQQAAIFFNGYFSGRPSRIHPQSMAVDDATGLHLRLQLFLQAGREAKGPGANNFTRGKCEIVFSAVGIDPFVF